MFILNSSYMIILIYILDDIIIKIKKFVIQWRKFESKRSYIFKDIDFCIFWIFSDYILILIDF